MARFEWERAQRWERKSKPLPASTPKSRRYVAAQLARLKTEAQRRRGGEGAPRS